MINIRNHSDISSNEQDKIIQDAIAEYLAAKKFDRTFKRFQIERNRIQPENEGNDETVIRWGQTKEELKLSLLDAFDSANYEMFFGVWNKQLPNESEIRNPSKENQQHMDKLLALEFYINIYFAIIPFFPNRSFGSKEDTSVRRARSMGQLRRYLDTRGSVLCRRNTEFLPYFSLPAVSDPTTHPVFEELFHPVWSADLKKQLLSFLDSYLLVPRKLLIYEVFESKGKFKFPVSARRKKTITSTPLPPCLEDNFPKNDDTLVNEDESDSIHAQSFSMNHQHYSSGRNTRTEMFNAAKSSAKKEEKLLGFSSSILEAAYETLQALESCRNGQTLSDRFMISLKARLDAFSEILKEVWHFETPHPKRKSLPSQIKGVQNSHLGPRQLSDGSTFALPSMMDDSRHSCPRAYDEDSLSITSNGSVDSRPMKHTGRPPTIQLRRRRSRSIGSSRLCSLIDSKEDVPKFSTQPLQPSINYLLIASNLRQMINCALEKPSEKEGSAAALDGCLLLQALRWRVIQPPLVSTRSEIIDELLKSLPQLVTPKLAMSATLSLSGRHMVNDQEPSLMFMLLGNIAVHQQPMRLLAEYLIRLISTLCASKMYRSCVFSKDSSVPFSLLLLGCLSCEMNDTLIHQHLLGALQKSSLGRRAQRAMIQTGVLDWVVQRLHQHFFTTPVRRQTINTDFSLLDSKTSLQESQSSVLSDYSLEYATALLMNLCLSVEGKKHSPSISPDIIQLLIKMLDTKDLQVRHYVHGTLYGLLSVKALRDRARLSGLDMKLMQNSETLDKDFQRQVKYILRLLSKPETEDIAPPEKECLSADEDEDIQEEYYEWRDSLPENDLVVKYGLSTGSGVGEDLFKRQYYLSASPRSGTGELLRKAKKQLHIENLMKDNQQSLVLSNNHSPVEMRNILSPIKHSNSNSNLQEPEELQSRPRLLRTPSGSYSTASKYAPILSDQNKYPLSAVSRYACALSPMQSFTELCREEKRTELNINTNTAQHRKLGKHRHIAPIIPVDEISQVLIASNTPMSEMKI